MCFSVLLNLFCCCWIYFLYLYLCLKNKCHTTVDENYTKYSDLTTQNSISYWKRTALTIARSAQEDEPTANSQQATTQQARTTGRTWRERTYNKRTLRLHDQFEANSKRTQRNSRQPTSSGKQNTRCLSVRVTSMSMCGCWVVACVRWGDGCGACLRASMCSVIRFVVRCSAPNALAIGEESIEHVCALVYGSISNQNKQKPQQTEAKDTRRHVCSTNQINIDLHIGNKSNLIAI